MRRRIIVLLPLCALAVLTSAARWVGHAQTPPPAAADSANYTGQTSRMGTEDMLLGRRRFEAGARSSWHTHPVGQLLFVEQGRMRVQRRGQPAKDLGPGESDYTGANIPHWHGATPDQFVVQASISLGGIGPWLEKVTDDDYLGAPGQGRPLAGVTCEAPPAHCGAECARQLLGNPGNVTEPTTGRTFFLDVPCDLKPDEQVIVILNLHGAGSIGNWQRHYFPAIDVKEKYRLVIATPTAAGSGAIGASGAPAVRMWSPATDDAFLQRVTNLVIDRVGRANVKAFWLAGHSQGGMTSNRVVCSDFFKDKVDGWLSLSGGRIGPAPISPDFFGPSGPPAAPPGGGNTPRPGVAAQPACDISFIFTSGQHEITGLPETSPWAAKYSCGARTRRPDVVDSRAGYVTGAAPGRGASWGRAARPGTAEVFVYPNCQGGRVVADVLRLDKGHTEGLEPNVTETLVALMASAPGGKVRAPRR